MNKPRVKDKKKCKYCHTHQNKEKFDMKAEGSKKRVCLDCREIEVMRKASLFMKAFNHLSKTRSIKMKPPKEENQIVKKVENEVMRKASLFMKTFNPVMKCKSKMKDKLIIEDRIQIIPSMLFSPFDTKFLELSSSPVSSRY